MLHDVGTLTAGSGMRLGGALPGLDTPGLRGLWATAPYLHDGSAATLREFHELTELQRYRSYMEYLMTERVEAKEVRAYDTAPTLRRWHAALWATRIACAAASRSPRRSKAWAVRTTPSRERASRARKRADR